MEKTKNKLPVVISFSTSIILMIVGAFLIKYRSIVMDQIIFLLAISLASFGALLMVRKFRYNTPMKDFWISLAMIVVGVVLAIYSNQVTQWGLVAIGAIFVVYGVIVTVQSATSRRSFFLALGISRIIIGSALIVLAFVTGNAQSIISLITGIIALTLGLLFLVFEK